MPVTFTVSLNVTWILIDSPDIYVPLAVEEVTLVTVGAVVSITRSLLSASEPEAPGDGKVNVALFPDESFIVAPFCATKEVVAL